MSRTLHIRWNNWAHRCACPIRRPCWCWPPRLVLVDLRYPRQHTPGAQPRTVTVRLRCDGYVSNSSLKIYAAKHEASARRALRDWKHTVLASGDFDDAEPPALRHRHRARWEAW